MRDRAVQFMVVIGAATAFLVGTGLEASRRDAVFYLLASTASALSIVAIVFLMILLTPSQKRLWHYRLSALRMIKGIESRPPPNQASLIRALAIKNGEMHKENEILLRSLRKSYRWLVAVGIIQLTVWAALVWTRR
jgi:hypothetical protein